jgi:hypothetical protein
MGPHDVNEQLTAEVVEIIQTQQDLRNHGTNRFASDS